MIRIFNHYVSRTGFILLLFEMLILHAAASATVLLWGIAPRNPTNVYLSGLVFALVNVFAMSALGMYQQQLREDLRSMAARIAPAFVLGFLLMAVLAQVLPAARFAGAGGVGFVLGGACVLLTRVLLFTSSQSNILVERLILVGDGALARECLELAASRGGPRRFDVVGCVPMPGEVRCVPAAKVLPPGESLLSLARRHGASELVVSVSERRSGAYPVRELLDCALGGVRVTDAAAFFEREASQIRVDSLQPSYLIYGGGFDQSFFRAFVKRSFDLVASAAICALTLPVMFVAALCIVLEDGGPVIFRQERVGKDGRLFQVLKFRSMGTDAERDGQPRWASAGDPRVTRVGHWLRKLRIDELPQMINVFRGEMSFVGPRPERAYFVEKLGRDIAYYDVRHSIKPGITGLAQVRYQYGASVDDAVRKLQYDLYYVKNNSLFLDLLILIDTVQVVLSGKGAR
ncbi:sugar transferase (PEP-CTERM system associated)/exopolysaccharide biosynthesis polyprenyl glycosylphosphotransferase [Pseudoduganella flava]|uniref:Sugar transferase (PEP-CTERM system associated)/exopolysaccharide biosynthesis polyprenyl glycosylphosphotransferase n=1 Tax=Pseudoduganella flava TaxID=871742 RepID=A0A562PRE4_9BURK|nr:TIGR03013 family XrtA/PEP-CTERM system glycosyltransferase [Pseudoduganella flava]QGZ37814.1 TIGR03013 family PEP-CTERM/XrtA system glycosyltransferase [Pseudoduganella flava]TWI46636.1 sugar transferase (PEP-CTERM system associated)/exopolysaccharide biosynthesis polyprenyl glycosylphosphotransferase [Pseudoduganella flava]